MTRQAAMYSRSRGSSHNRRRGRDQLGQVNESGEIHALARGQGLHDRAIRFPQRERNEIHGIGEEIAIRIGQADEEGAAGRGIAALTWHRCLAAGATP